MGIFANILNPVLNPLLPLGPVLVILIISIVVSLIITLVYKFATNQEKMKELKLEMKSRQKQMKEMKGEPDKLMSMQKEAMKKNMEYMKHSFKATLITFIPIIIIFGWMQANLAFDPLEVGNEFTMTTVLDKGLDGEVEIISPEEIEILSEKNQTGGEIDWRLEPKKEGNFYVDFKYKGKIFSKEIDVGGSAAEPIETYEGGIKTIQVNHEKLKPLGNISLFGWQPGWLALYIVFSIVFSMSLRKLFKLY